MGIPKTLPHTPTPETVKMLSRAKALLVHADKHMHIDTDIDRMIAVHNLDNAVEYLLRTLLIHLSYEEWEKAMPLPSIVDLKTLCNQAKRFLEDRFQLKLKYTDQVGLIRQLRNGIQHGLVDPTRDIDRIKNVIHRLFDHILSTCFGAAVSDLTYSRLVREKILSRILKACEKAIDRKNYEKAVACARNAFDFANILLEHDDDPLFDAIPAKLSVANEHTHLANYVETIQRQLSLTKQNVNWQHYKRYVKVTQYVSGTYREGGSGWNVKTAAWTKDEAEFCYSFACDYIFRNSRNFRDYSETGTAYDSHEYLGGVNLDQMRRTCDYSGYAPYDQIILGHVERPLYRRLRKVAGVVLRGTSFMLGAKRVVHGSKVAIRYREFKLVCHDPAIWRVCIGINEIPFTAWHFERTASRIYNRTIVLNRFSDKRLHGALGDRGFSVALCKRIIARRKKLGGFASGDDLKSIRGITERRFSLLQACTTLNPISPLPDIATKLLE